MQEKKMRLEKCRIELSDLELSQHDINNQDRPNIQQLDFGQVFGKRSPTGSLGAANSERYLGSNTPRSNFSKKKIDQQHLSDDEASPSFASKKRMSMPNARSSR